MIIGQYVYLGQQLYLVYNSESFKDIYRESNDKWLLVSICIWDSDEFLGYAMNIE